MLNQELTTCERLTFAVPAMPRSHRKPGDDRSRRRSGILSGCLLAVLCLAGCTPFSTSGAREVTRDRLLQLADAGHTDHMQYVGSDGAWHYVYDSRPDRMRTYKVRSDQMALKDTFEVGEDEPYVLHADVIEGKLLGAKPQR